MLQTAPITQSYSQLLANQRAFFATGKTLDVNFRKLQLQKLIAAIEKYEPKLYDAIHKDSRKSQFEYFGTEIGVTLSDIRHTLSNLRSWAKPKRVGTQMFHFIGSSRIYSEPYGSVLIMGAWNYPFLLLIQPLVGAIAAGNTVVLKPSELAWNTSNVIAEMIQETFPPEYVAICEGDAEVAKGLLQEKWDYIFFTGGTEIGRLIYQSAAKNLTPVTLELGGKSPCLIDEEVHIDYAAKRLVWGRFVNCGQTCVSPDYLLLNRKVKDKFMARLKTAVTEIWGENPQKNDHYARMINDRHFQRVAKLIEPEKVIIGGQTDAADRFIAPTFMEIDSWDSPIMKEEIFGPVCPIILYDDFDKALNLIRSQPKPLAAYIFSTNETHIHRFQTEISFGGGCVNDVMVHLGNGNLPFGGVGDSGIGQYHGVHSFDTFSHKKAILRKSNLMDMPIRYLPHKFPVDILRKIYRWTLG
ncbi:MAG: aldehyde dehydrogenase [Bacteroidia bacterium]